MRPLRTCEALNCSSFSLCLAMVLSGCNEVMKKNLKVVNGAQSHRTEEKKGCPTERGCSERISVFYVQAHDVMVETDMVGRHDKRGYIDGG